METPPPVAFNVFFTNLFVNRHGPVIYLGPQVDRAAFFALYGTPPLSLQYGNLFKFYIYMHVTYKALLSPFDFRVFRNLVLTLLILVIAIALEGSFARVR